MLADGLTHMRLLSLSDRHTVTVAAALVFLLAVAVAVSAHPTAHSADAPSLMRNNSADVAAHLDKRDDDDDCQIPEGYFVIFAQAQGTDDSIAGGVYLSPSDDDDDDCAFQSGVYVGEPTGIIGCFFTKGSVPSTVDAVGYQHYFSNSITDPQYFVIGSAYEDSLPVIIFVGARQFSGYLQRTVLTSQEDDAFHAIKALCS